MKNLLLTLIMALSLSATVYAQQLPDSATYEVLQEIKKSLVVIHLPNKNLGSGVVIKSNEFGSLILTAKHVCDGALRLIPDTSEFRYIHFHLVRNNSFVSRKYYGQIVKYAINTDLCLIHTISMSLSTARISKKPIYVGNVLYNYGNPLPIYGLLTKGKFLQHDWSDQMMQYLISNKVAPGSSGSGIFNTDGELVGIVVMVENDTEYGLAVPLAQIRLFLYGVEH